MNNNRTTIETIILSILTKKSEFAKGKLALFLSLSALRTEEVP
jgi:hypothetical protein